MVFIQHTEIHGQSVIVEVDGPLDSETSPDFEDYIGQLLKNGFRYIMIDAENLGWVSSEGIGVTVLIQKKITEVNGAFVVFNLSREIMSLYGILGFDKIIRIAENRENALDIIGKEIEIRGTGPMTTIEAGDNDQDMDSGIFDKSSGNGIAEKTEYALTDSAGTGNGDDSIRFPEDDIPDTSLMDGSAPFDPFVIECAGCKSLIRIRKTGEFMCPSCKTEFTVMEDQTVIF